MAGDVPAHVGIIMDGNGRWAESRGLPRLEGHREGSASVRAVTTCAREIGVRALTLYAFSSQNWSRPAEEVAGLMELLREYLQREKPTLLDNDIRLQTIGDVDRLPRFVRSVLDEVCEATSPCKTMILSLALSYGGREELVRAAQLIASDVAAGKLRPADVDAQAMEDRLYTRGLPELEVCIRTSGELRISNFLLWQVAYTEIVFADTAWPEFREEAFLEALLEFRGRERRFGLTSAQVRRHPPG
jgi:undecaprenyl diphosphate synthase